MPPAVSGKALTALSIAAAMSWCSLVGGMVVQGRAFSCEKGGASRPMLPRRVAGGTSRRLLWTREGVVRAGDPRVILGKLSPEFQSGQTVVDSITAISAHSRKGKS